MFKILRRIELQDSPRFLCKSVDMKLRLMDLATPILRKRGLAMLVGAAPGTLAIGKMDFRFSQFVRRGVAAL
jgi:hypothetical protein